MTAHATVACFALVLSAVSESTAASIVPAREGEELAGLRATSPRAAELVEQGDALAAAGRLEEADALFRQGHAEYPGGALPWRRDCETRTALGPRREAVLACAEALERRRSDATVRTLVSALVDGPAAPSTTDIFEALTVVAKERDNPLGRVSAAAAACDIAERIGDGAMLQVCAGELERLAPDDPATRAARAALISRCPPWRFWGGWAAIAALVAVTLGDALRRSLRRMPRRASAASAAAVLGALLAAAPGIARADETPTPRGALSRWPIDPEHPEKAIPSAKDRDANPLEFGYWLQDVALQAEHASKEGNHATAATLYAVLGQVVPDRAVSYVKMCEEYEALGELDRAINACGEALLRDGARVSDYARFVHLELGRSGRLGGRDTAALARVLAHLREDPAGSGTVDDLECQVGARTSNVEELEECTGHLAARAPEDPRTISYEWALAIARGKFEDARRVGERARTAGFEPESLASMASVTAAGEARHRREVLLVAATLALLLGALGVAARAVARRGPALGVTGRTS